MVYHGNQAQEKKLRVAKGFESRKWLQDIQLFLSKQKNPNLNWQIFFGTFFFMFLRSIPPKHVKMMVIWCNSAKKDWFCAQFGKNALQSIFNQGKFLRGLMLLVRISSRGKISKQSISPLEPSNTWKKKGTKKNLSI